MKTAYIENEIYADVYRFAWAILASRQPVLPRWIQANSDCSTTRKGGRVLTHRLYLFKRRILQEGEAWERTRYGFKTLTTTDPRTGKKMYTILDSFREDDIVVIFEMDLDIDSRKITITKESVVAELNINDYELYYEY